MASDDLTHQVLAGCRLPRRRHVQCIECLLLAGEGATRTPQLLSERDPTAAWQVRRLWPVRRAGDGR